MRKLIAVAVLALLSGCAHVDKNCEMTLIYRPDPLGGQVGDIRRVEDHETGVVFYWLTEAGRDVMIGAYVTKDARVLTAAEMVKTEK